jgi:hypothetical protein
MFTWAIRSKTGPIVVMDNLGMTAYAPYDILEFVLIIIHLVLLGVA